MKNIFKSESGFSIVQGMVLAGAVATLAMVGTRLITDQKSAQKFAAQRNKVEQLHDMVRTMLVNKDHCTQTFSTANNTIETPPNTIKSGMIPNASRSFRKIVTSNNATVFQVNSTGTYDPTLTYMNNSITIDRMVVQYPADLMEMATMRVSYRKVKSDTDVSIGGEVSVKDIPIVIERDSLSNFSACYAVASELGDDLTEQFCKNYGDGVGSYFQWDDVNHACKPKDQVCTNGAFVGFDARGDKICRSFEQWLDFNEILDNSAPLECAGADDVRFHTSLTPNKVKVFCTEPNKCVKVDNLTNDYTCDSFNRKNLGFTASGGSGAYEFRLHRSSAWVSTSTLPIKISNNELYTVDVRDVADHDRQTSFQYNGAGCNASPKYYAPMCGPICLDMVVTMDDSCAPGYSGSPLMKEIRFTATNAVGFILFQPDPFGAQYWSGQWTGGYGPPQTHGERRLFMPNMTYTLEFQDTADNNRRRRFKVEAGACGSPGIVTPEPCGMPKAETCLNITSVTMVPSCDTTGRNVNFTVAGGSGQYECSSGYADPVYSDCSSGATGVYAGWGNTHIWVRDKTDHYKNSQIDVTIPMSGSVPQCGGTAVLQPCT